MATYTSAKTAKGYSLQLILTETVDTANNRSSIAYTLKMISTNYNFSTIRIGYSLSVEGTVVGSRAYSSSDYYDLPKNSNITLATGTFTVNHDSDGSKSIAAGQIVFKSLTATGEYAPNITASNGTAYVLTNIPRESTMTVPATMTMGKAATFSIESNSTSFKHTITYSFGSSSPATGTVGSEKTSSTSISWTPPFSLAAKLNITGGTKSGTITFVLKTYSGNTQIGSDKTYTATLKAPTASLSIPTFTIGTQGTITISEQDSSFKHTIVATTLAGSSISSTYGAIATLTTATSVNWTPNATLAQKIRTTTSGTVTYTHTAYASDGTTVVAYNTYSKTMNAPATKPTVGTFTKTVTDSPISGVYVQNNSKVAVSVTVSSSTYAYIVSAKLTIDGVSTSYNWTDNVTSKTISKTSGVLSNSGSRTISVTVTDSRGYTNSASTTISVQSYANPTLLNGSGEDSIICARCDQDGNLTSSGTYLKIKVGRKISNFSGNTGYIAYKVGTGSETVISTSTAQNAYAAPSPVSGFSVTSTYTVVIRAYDTVGKSISRTYTIQSDSVTLNLRTNGNGVGIGKYAAANHFDVAWATWIEEKLYSSLYSSHEASATSSTRSHFLIAPAYTYNDILSGTIESTFPYSAYCEAWLRQICSDYAAKWGGTYLNVVGTAQPSSRGMIAAHVYNPNATTNGLPTSSTGVFFPYTESGLTHGGIVRFGTVNGAFWIKGIYDNPVTPSVTYTENSIITSASNLGITIRASGHVVTMDFQPTLAAVSGGSSAVEIARINTSSFFPQSQVALTVSQQTTTVNFCGIYVTSGGVIRILKNNTSTGVVRANLSWITA